MFTQSHCAENKDLDEVKKDPPIFLESGRWAMAIFPNLKDQENAVGRIDWESKITRV